MQAYWNLFQSEKETNYINWKKRSDSAFVCWRERRKKRFLFPSYGTILQLIPNLMSIDTWQKVAFVPSLLILVSFQTEKKLPKCNAYVCVTVWYNRIEKRLFEFECIRLSWFCWLLLIFSVSASLFSSCVPLIEIHCIEMRRTRRMCTLAQHVIVTVSFLVRHILRYLSIEHGTCFYS